MLMHSDHLIFLEIPFIWSHCSVQNNCTYWILYFTSVLEALQFNTVVIILYFYSFKVLVVYLQGGIMLSPSHSSLLVFAVKTHEITCPDLNMKMTKQLVISR